MGRGAVPRERRWAVEGAGNPFVAPLVAELLDEGERAFDVPPSLTSRYRSRGGRKKNDLVDAENAARALIANPRLPAYRPRPYQRELKELTRNRSRLAEQLKANRMALKGLPEGSACRGALERVVACLAEEAKTSLEKAMTSLVERAVPEILEIRGVGGVLGATILAEVGDVSRFEKESRFTAYCGAAPVDRGSGKRNSRVAVNPGGNRTMNRVVHLVAQVRLRTEERSKQRLFARKRAEGKTLREAWRVLKTYVARELYRKLKAIDKSRDLGSLAA